MHTKDRLAHELEIIGLADMAAKAREGYYDDFLSPLDAPIMALVTELAGVRSMQAIGLRQRVINGEFDATTAESDAWAASPEGQATMSLLTKKK